MVWHLFTKYSPNGTFATDAAVVNNIVNILQWSVQCLVTDTSQFYYPAVTNITKAKALFQRQCPDGAIATKLRIYEKKMDKLFIRWVMKYGVTQSHRKNLFF